MDGVSDVIGGKKGGIIVEIVEVLVAENIFDVESIVMVNGMILADCVGLKSMSRFFEPEGEFSESKYASGPLIQSLIIGVFIPALLIIG
jgi:hypothetical protein